MKSRKDEINETHVLIPNCKKILIIGAGAAGIACAYSLSLFPEQYELHVWEKSNKAGGVAFSEEIELENGEKQLINVGVQGGSSTYRNTLRIHQILGNFSPNKVEMKVSFGKGKESNWTNYNRSPLVEKLQPEIKRFGELLKWVSRFELIFVCIPIAKLLSIFNFSKEFGEKMVFPLTALFFGTGNQTHNVSSAIVARVFLDDDLRLFDYDPDLLLSQSPQMFSFEILDQIYETLVRKINVNFSFNRSVQSIHRGKEVKKILQKNKLQRKFNICAIDDKGMEEFFDEVVFACDAETALKSLSSPSWLEKWTLGNVKYFDDVSITHTDLDYIQKYYDIDLSRDDQYFVRNDQNDPKILEMSFNLSNYQRQLNDKLPIIFQSIFLDKTKDDKWSIKDIDANKILLTNWWRQFAHTWTHFIKVVPFVRFIQNQNHTWYTGSYTLVNTHEIATISGLAVAHRLGAYYPFEDDPLALKQFKTYLSVIHGVSFSPSFCSQYFTLLLFITIVFIFVLISVCFLFYFK